MGGTCNLTGFEPSWQTPSSSNYTKPVEKLTEPLPLSSTSGPVLQIDFLRLQPRPTPRELRNCTRSHPKPSAETPKVPSSHDAPTLDIAASTAPSVGASTSGPSSSGQTIDYSEVVSFLQGLATPLPELLPRFITNGIWDLKALHALSRVSEKRLDLFLRKDLDLNPFQACIVGQGLELLQ